MALSSRQPATRARPWTDPLVCVLCQEIGCKVIGEMIEDEAAASLAAKLGVGYGQGWLFGKPVQGLPKPIRSMRRKGTTETWQ